MIENVNDNNYSYLWEKVDELAFQDVHFKNDDARRAYLRKLIKTNLPQATLDEKRSEYYLILGYLNYFSEKKQSLQDTLKYFRYATRLNENNYLAWMYLGFCRFDKKQWDLARKAFERFPENILTHGDVVLRNKIAELKLCCELYLCPTEKTINEIKEFLQVLASLDEEDRALPIELQLAIEHTKFNSTAKEILLSLVKSLM